MGSMRFSIDRNFQQQGMAWLRDAHGRLVRNGAPPPHPKKKKPRARRRSPKLAELPSDVLARVFSCFSSADDPRRMLLARSVSRTLSEALTATVRRTWTRVDTHLVRHHLQLHLLRAAVAARCAPRELVVASLSNEDARMTFSWLIDTLDPTHLACISLKTSALGSIMAAMLHSNVDSIDLTVPLDAAAPQTFRSFISWHGAVATSTLHAVSQISSLRKLDLRGANRGFGSLDALSAITNLEHLSVSIQSYDFYDRRDLTTYNPNELSQIIPSLQNLHTLNLASTHAPQMSLQSSSLRVLDIRGTAKHFCLSHIDCPNLTEFHCLNARYGNGVRRVLDGDFEHTFFDNNATSYDPLGVPSPFDTAGFLDLQNMIERLDSYDFSTSMAILNLKCGLVAWLSIPAGNFSWVSITPGLSIPIALPPACEVHFHAR